MRHPIVHKERTAHDRKMTVVKDEDTMTGRKNNTKSEKGFKKGGEEEKV